MHVRHVILNPEAYYLSNKKSNEPVKSLYAIFWVIHRRLKMEDGTESVPKRRHINFKRR
jgi:hypothetical protein